LIDLQLSEGEALWEGPAAMQRAVTIALIAELMSVTLESLYFGPIQDRWNYRTFCFLNHSENVSCMLCALTGTVTYFHSHSVRINSLLVKRSITDFLSLSYICN
jgi:hypothetical protein